MNLPADVVYEILSFLPAKSLCRCKVLCKDWYTHMHNKSFIAKHTKNQIANPKIFIHHRDGGGENHGVSICSEEQIQLQEGEEEEEDGDDDGIPSLFNQSKQQHYFIKDMPLKHSKRSKMSPEVRNINIIGTCNGIVCFDWYRLYNKFITLWNPTTREFNTLPPFQRQSPPGTCIYRDHVGFGFDSSIDDYKGIRILYFQKEEYNCLQWQDKYIIQMKIYSLGTNLWREFDCSCLPSKIKGGYNSSVIVGNKLSWLAKGIKSNERIILSFGMGKEVFQKTPLPSEYWQFWKKGHLTELFHMHDSVSLVLSVVSGDGMTLEIWNTKDLDQGRSSWIKLSSIGPISIADEPLGFGKCKYNNDLLFIFSSKWFKNKEAMAGVYMNNPGQNSNNRLMKIKITNCIISRPMQVLTYVETLVSV